MDGSESAFSLLERLTTGSSEERLSIHDINNEMGERAFGIVLLLFTLPNCFPIPGIPGVSTITGLPVVIFAAQMAFGAKHPFLPAWIQKYSITRGTLAKILRKAEPYWLKMEKAVRPRWFTLIDGKGDRLIGLIAFMLAVLLSLPIPAGNLLPAIALAVLSLGLIQRDGVAVLIGYALSAAAIVWIGLLILAGEKILKFLQQLFF